VICADREGGEQSELDVGEIRLKKLGYTDLELRRKRSELIQIYKITKEFEDVDLVTRIGRSNEGRSHTHQILKEGCRGSNVQEEDSCLTGLRLPGIYLRPI